MNKRLISFGNISLEPTSLKRNEFYNGFVSGYYLKFKDQNIKMINGVRGVNISVVFYVDEDGYVLF